MWTMILLAIKPFFGKHWLSLSIIAIVSCVFLYFVTVNTHLSTTVDDLTNKNTQLTSQVTELQTDMKLQKQDFKKVKDALATKAKYKEDQKDFHVSIQQLPKTEDRPFDDANNLVIAKRMHDRQQEILGELDAGN